MLENVLPVIKSKWPRGDRDKDDIIIQEDNAKPHHARIRAAVEKAAKDDKWNVAVKPQPPNRPDFNVNDLQNLQHKQAAKILMKSLQRWTMPFVIQSMKQWITFS